jgi:hypothetical protein
MLKIFMFMNKRIDQHEICKLLPEIIHRRKIITSGWQRRVNNCLEGCFIGLYSLAQEHLEVLCAFTL